MTRFTYSDQLTSGSYKDGCEFCGARIPALRDNGLDNAHIIATGYAPEHRWNVLVLCHSCHRILDQVVKPRIADALRVAASGFRENPSNNEAPKYIVSSDWKRLIEMLDANVVEKERLPDIDLRMEVWLGRNGSNSLDSARL